LDVVHSVSEKVIESTDGVVEPMYPKILSARHCWLVSLALAGLGCLIMPWDVSLSRWVHEHPPEANLRSVFDRAETFGHGTGVVMILITIALLARPSRRQITWLAAAAFGAGQAANLLKCFVIRPRPSALPAEEAFASFSMVDWSGNPGIVFLSHVRNSSLHSFPSAHSATAFGLAIALGHSFPRGRWWFLGLAGLVGCHRVCAEAHYPSDVLMGAALGISIGAWAMRRLERSEAVRAERLPTVSPYSVETAEMRAV
jgi:membrane-associated phospholipid phosphatase